MKPNKAQLEAVRHKSGPLLIVAGAGTGKTAVITEKIKYLIESGVKPQEILALTFTEKAATEMIERLDEVMPLGYEEPWVSTFHKFGDRVLKAEALEIGLDPGYEILSRAKQWLLLKKYLFEFDLDYYRPLGNPNKFIGAMINFFSRIRDEDVSAEEVFKFSTLQVSKAKTSEEKEQAEKLLEVAKAFGKYQELKRVDSVLDFGDLISETLRLFRKRKSVLAKYRKQFKYVLVDEFQDTNFAQYQLVKLLAYGKSGPQLTVVGDDSQSIYRFRGAAISNILNFMKDYPKAKQIVLTENYRSYQPILDGAYKLIKNNDPETLESKLGIDKNLKSLRGKGKRKPEIIECEGGDQEVEFVVKKILELLAGGKNSYSDFVIMARANSQLEPYVTALKQVSLPYRRVGNRGLFDQDEIRMLTNFLAVVADPNKSVNLFGLLYYPGFKIDPEKIIEWLSESKRKSASLWEVVKNKPEAKKAVGLVKTAQEKVVSDRASKILFEFINSSGYLEQFVEDESLENNLKLKNLNLFFNYVRDLERTDESLRVVELVELLDELVEAGENPSQAEIEDVDAVTLTTAHSAKGLEFSVVFMVSLVAGRFPGYGRRDPIELPDGILKESLPSEDNTAEERRLFYVGMTRAKNRLFMSWASDYGGVHKWKASGFLEETGIKTENYLSESQLSLLNLKPEAAPVMKMGEKKFELAYTSYSQIDTFKACPLKYKYRYLLQIPAQPHHALSFGRSIHETLKEFHQLEAGGKKPSKKELLAMYEKNFVDEGYESDVHKKKRYEAGKKALETYYEVYKQKLGKPVMLEKDFRLKIAGTVLIGKIDRIDETENGFEIVDYKTGSSDKKDKVNRDEQLSIYALAAKEALGIKASKLALYFIEDNEKAETSRSEKQLEKKRAELEDTIEKMKKSEFEAKPGYPFPCSFCEYRKICPFAAKPR